jgi:prefoldin beta subunit
MEVPKNVQHQIAQFQQMQQQAQAITMQKQNVELQIRESEKALEELKNVEDDSDVYKTAGNLLIKVDKVDVTKELEDKIETLHLREKTVQRQEERIMKKLQEMQTSLQDAMQGSGLQPGLGN